MKTQKFGTRLREIRKQVDMSQRTLASKVGIDFTYLSKIESGIMPPPSEKVIIKLARFLGANKDELITLAGKIPSDLSHILRDESVVRFLRSSNSEEIARFLKEKNKLED